MSKIRLENLGSHFKSTTTRDFKGGVLVDKRGRIQPIMTPSGTQIKCGSKGYVYAYGGSVPLDKSKEKRRPSKWDYSYTDKG